MVVSSRLTQVQVGGLALLLINLATVVSFSLIRMTNLVHALFDPSMHRHAITLLVGGMGNITSIH